MEIKDAMSFHSLFELAAIFGVELGGEKNTTTKFIKFKSTIKYRMYERTREMVGLYL